MQTPIVVSGSHIHFQKKHSNIDPKISKPNKTSGHGKTARMQKIIKIQKFLEENLSRINANTKNFKNKTLAEVFNKNRSPHNRSLAQPRNAKHNFMKISKQVDETEPDLRAHQCPTQINFQFDSASTKMFDYMTSSKIQPKYIFNKRRVLSNSPVSSRKEQNKSSYS